MIWLMPIDFRIFWIFDIIPVLWSSIYFELNRKVVFIPFVFVFFWEREWTQMIIIIFFFFGIWFVDKYYINIRYELISELISYFIFIHFIDWWIGIALSQDEWRVLIRSLVCLCWSIASPVPNRRPFELDSNPISESLHIYPFFEFLYLTPWLSWPNVIHWEKPCNAIFCVWFCFYCFRSILPIDRDSYHLLQCIIHRNKIINPCNTVNLLERQKEKPQRMKKLRFCPFPPFWNRDWFCE